MKERKQQKTFKTAAADMFKSGDMSENKAWIWSSPVVRTIAKTPDFLRYTFQTHKNNADPVTA